MKMEPPKQFNEQVLAVDVAAFANTAGGVLLIGAHEHPKDSGVLHSYVPMRYKDASAIDKLLKNALDLCSPRPIAEAKPIALDAGKDEYVVAINCDPYAAPPIGVMLEKEKGGPKFWCFPARRGTHNRHLRPEELATIMEPRLRRMLLLFDQIPTYQPQNRRRAHFHSQQGSNYHTLDIISISTESSSIQLCQDSRRGDLMVPLDALRMIWRSSDNGMFHVYVMGKIRPTDSTDVGLEFVPG